MISLTRPEIEGLTDQPSAAETIENAYPAASRGEINLPPIGHITFPGNGTVGLSSGNGVVLVLSAETGQMEAILHDEMVLPDIRIGLGGAITSRTLTLRTNKSWILFWLDVRMFRSRI